MKALAAAGASEGSWLRADRQTGGRGRSGRTWVSPPGNLYASTIVRLQAGDPPAPTLALVAGLALFEAVRPCAGEGVRLKWPNDLHAGNRKLGGILLERGDDVVVVGIGLNLAHHPDDADRPATSLSGEGWPHPSADAMLANLAGHFFATLSTWRSEGLEVVRRAWIAAAHPIGTPLATHGPDGSALAGTFDGLDHDGACRLRLADGGVRLIHAGDVFLV